MMLLQVLSVVLCGFLDRMRGDPKNIINRTVEKLLYGVVAGFLTVGQDNYYNWAAFAALFAVGSSPGWGEPIAAAIHDRKMKYGALEWWQVGTLKDNVPMALLARGLLWSLPCCLVAFYNIHALEVLVMCPVFALSLYITKAIDKYYGLKDVWASNEWVRGLLFGGVCAAI